VSVPLGIPHTSGPTNYQCERRCEIDRQRRFPLDHLIANTSL
jgi:hypothetical protein